MKKLFVLILALCLILSITGCGYTTPQKAPHHSQQTTTTTSGITKEPRIETINNMPFLVISNGNKGQYATDYVGDYLIQNISSKQEEFKDKKLDINSFNTSTIMSLEKYKNFCETHNLRNQYEDDNKEYVVITHAINATTKCNIRVADISVSEDRAVTIIIEQDVQYTAVNENVFIGYFLTVPIDKNYKEVKVVEMVSEELFEQYKKGQ